MGRPSCLLALLACIALGACARDDERAPGGQPGSADALPAPGAVSGSVTGMPDPGQARATPLPPVAGAPDATDPALAVDPAVNQIDGGMPAGSPDPGVDAAVDVLRNYYAALNARDYASAYAAWADGGRASGQSPGAFAAGFDAIDGASVQLGAPGPLQGDAYDRRLIIPASVEVRQADGSLRRYAGSYTLRLEGGDPAQRQWRIATAALEERP